MKDSSKKITLEELNKSNIWTLDENDLYKVFMDCKHKELLNDEEAHYYNIVRTVFDIKYLNRDDAKNVSILESQHYMIFSAPNDGDCNAIAIRKRPIARITDLTLENIQHTTPQRVLDLIESNMGTGWKGLPLQIQDIIESAYYVDCSVLPSNIMNRPGGIAEKRKNDGYASLEIARGGWTEAVFIKQKPKTEKIHCTVDADEEMVDDLGDSDIDAIPSFDE